MKHQNRLELKVRRSKLRKNKLFRIRLTFWKSKLLLKKLKLRKRESPTKKLRTIIGIQRLLKIIQPKRLPNK